MLARAAGQVADANKLIRALIILAHVVCADRRSQLKILIHRLHGTGATPPASAGKPPEGTGSGHRRSRIRAIPSWKSLHRKPGKREPGTTPGPHACPHPAESRPQRSTSDPKINPAH
jgi:hypothetical protein